MLLLAGTAALATVLSQGAASAHDWLVSFYPTAQGYVHGATRLYDDPSAEFYYPPWSLIIFIPASVLGYVPGLAVLRLVSLAALAVVAYAWAPPNRIRPLLVALAVGSLYTLDMLALGQVVAFVVLGIWVAWWAVKRRLPGALVLGLALMGIKPQLTLLPAVVVLVGLRYWPRRLLVKAGAWLLVLIGLSVVMSGPDWPVRYVRYVQGMNPPPSEPITSVYRLTGDAGGLVIAAVTVGVVVWLVWRLREGRPTMPLLLMATAANMAFSPFVHDYDFPLLMTLVWPSLAVRTPVAAGLAYGLHFAFYLIPGTVGLHALVALVLLGGAIWYYASGKKEDNQANEGNDAKKPEDLAAGEGERGQRIQPLHPD